MKESDPDYPGIRPAQHVIALAALGAICFWAGYPLWESALRSFLAWGFLTWVAQSIPHVWKFFDLVNERISLRRGSSWVNGETTYAEWACGAIVWGLACAL